MISQKQFFWVSFLPAAAYWYLEANYSLQIALAGGLLLAIVEMFLEWIFTKHIHTLSRFNFFLILVLGGIAFIAHEGIWFKLQPAFTGVIMGSYLLYKQKKMNSLMLEMVKLMNKKNMPDEIILYIEKNMAIFLFFYGLFMAVVAIKFSTDLWLFFKTAGFYIVTILFFIIQIFFLKKKMRTFL